MGRILPLSKCFDHRGLSALNVQRRMNESVANGNDEWWSTESLDKALADAWDTLAADPELSWDALPAVSRECDEDLAEYDDEDFAPSEQRPGCRGVLVYARESDERRPDLAYAAACHTAWQTTIRTGLKIRGVFIELGSARDRLHRPIFDKVRELSRLTGYPIVSTDHTRLIRPANASDDHRDVRPEHLAELRADGATYLLELPWGTPAEEIKRHRTKRGFRRSTRKLGRPRQDRTTRQHEVLRLHRLGLSVREIGSRLGVGKSTVARDLSEIGCTPNFPAGGEKKNTVSRLAGKRNQLSNVGKC